MQRSVFSRFFLLLLLSSTVFLFLEKGVKGKQQLSTSAQTSATSLTVTSEVIANTSKMLLGQASLSDFYWSLDDPRFKNLVKEIKPGISRFPHYRYYWQRASNMNVWLNGWNTWSYYSIDNGSLSANVPNSTYDTTEASRGVFQRFLPNQFEAERTYCLSFTYRGSAVGDTSDRRGIFLNVYYYEEDPWWQNGTGFLVGKIPSGDSPTSQSSNCRVYAPDPTGRNRTVAFLQLETALGVAGQAWFDNVRVYSTDNPSFNLVSDSGFDTTLFPLEESLDSNLRGYGLNFNSRFTSKGVDDFMTF